eukprot:CAMPEP_0179483774 /NCGR_PEP_ID=MMETSP0799-20121207/60861_1 /TAXON_ID=46947 /ORGANISM="Geminigera cryophila, Strain CCMP2564" /LENGTH=245 /DNA_ID=CAMNT_0021297435 /DNA_START=113 /DNA_END=846 /DNA_ORIENTATION=-
MSAPAVGAATSAPLPAPPQANPQMVAAVDQFGHDGNEESKTSVLTPEQAVLIFTSRTAKSSKLRDSSSSKLAKEYGVTTKAVRDIWNMRTWVWTTMSYWSDEDMKTFLKKRLCKDCKLKNVERIEDTCEKCAIRRRRGCKLKNVERIEDTCEKCAIRRRRGRPMGSKDKQQRIRRPLGLNGARSLADGFPGGSPFNGFSLGMPHGMDMSQMPQGLQDALSQMPQGMQFMNPALMMHMQGLAAAGG